MTVSWTKEPLAKTVGGVTYTSDYTPYKGDEKWPLTHGNGYLKLCHPSKATYFHRQLWKGFFHRGGLCITSITSKPTIASPVCNVWRGKNTLLITGGREGEFLKPYGVTTPHACTACAAAAVRCLQPAGGHA